MEADNEVRVSRSLYSVNKDTNGNVGLATIHPGAHFELGMLQFNFAYYQFQCRLHLAL